MTDTERHLARHMLATIAYRGGKALRDAPADFGEFRPDGAFNTPLTLVAHIADLLEWTRRWCDGGEDTYRVNPPATWDDEVARFYLALSAIDARLASDDPIEVPLERVFQAPIADALTHIGQIALLRRMAGAPVLGEAYRQAEIVAGRLGPTQAPPGREFALNKGAVWRPPETR